jgi:hypothetical protein
MKKATNPIAARVEVLPGRRLEAKWQQNLENVGGAYDRRDLENMWREPQWSAKTNSTTTENVIQAARLSK